MWHAGKFPPSVNCAGLSILVTWLCLTKCVLRVLSLNVFTVVFLSVYLVKKGPTGAQEAERDV